MPNNSTLTWLDLSHNWIGDTGAQMLSYTHGLTFLNLARNLITDRGATALANHKKLKSKQ